MNRNALIIILFIIILYYLKVPTVVTTINGLLVPLTTVWNYLIDVGTNVRERHPWIWISLFFILWYTMIPPANKGQ